MEAIMAEISATDAKNRFGQLLEMARKEPVRIQKNGRDVGVMASPEYFEQSEKARSEGAVNSLIARLHAKSKERWGKVYEALAK
jgi:prevent-host-death family protein